MRQISPVLAVVGIAFACEASATTLPLLQSTNATVSFQLIYYAGSGGTAINATVPVNLTGQLEFAEGPSGPSITDISLTVSSAPLNFVAQDVYGREILLSVSSILWTTSQSIPVTYVGSLEPGAGSPVFIDPYLLHRTYVLQYGGQSRLQGGTGCNCQYATAIPTGLPLATPGTFAVSLEEFFVGTQEIQETYFDAGTLRFQNLHLSASQLVFANAPVPEPSAAICVGLGVTGFAIGHRWLTRQWS